MQAVRKLSFSLELTHVAAQALAKGISQSKLESLELGGLIYEQPDRIRKIFYQGLQSVQTLKELKITHTPATQLDGLNPVLQSIETLRVGNVEFNQYGDLLRGVLVGRTALKKLELRDCDIGDNNSGMVLLAQALRHNTTITCLVLNHLYSEENGSVGV